MKRHAGVGEAVAASSAGKPRTLPVHPSKAFEQGCRQLSKHGLAQAEGEKWRGVDSEKLSGHDLASALEIHADDPAFGYRFIPDELPESGITAGENQYSACAPTTPSGRCPQRTWA